MVEVAGALAAEPPIAFRADSQHLQALRTGLHTGLAQIDSI
jgi:hypothetical protein